MKQKKQTLPSSERNIALCYARQSVTKDDSDRTSIDRQVSAMQEFAATQGWIAEVYVDAQGHRSGRNEENRPEWMRLKERLSDPRVVALLCWDMSRLHRNLVGMLATVDICNSRNITLYEVKPNGGKLSPNQDYLRLVIQGLKDQLESRDTSDKVLHGIAHRKRQGKGWARPPFGTVRNADGYLIPSPYGVWITSDGQVIKGVANQPPADGALWRGYFDAVQRIYELYVQGYGTDRISRLMNDDGYMFCDRGYEPVAFESDDIRRIVSSWPTYGGNTQGGRAQDKRFFQADIESVSLYPERALFDVGFLRQVGNMLKERSLQPRQKGLSEQDHVYPLAELVYCAHCEAAAQTANNPKLRSRLTGKSQNRYRHRPGVKCDCKAKSVSSEVIEGQFGQILERLSLKQEYVDVVKAAMLQAAIANDAEQADFEKVRNERIAKYQRQIEAARDLYLNAELEREDYLARRQKAEREIELLRAQVRPVDEDLANIEQVNTLLENLRMFWEVGTTEERNITARLLLESLVYDLDLKRFTGINLKPWACKYLQYAMAVGEMLEMGTQVTPTGIKGSRRFITGMTLLLKAS